jgi:Pentapeptide repeats (8 copies)
VADPEHLEFLHQGVEAWNAWRRENLSIVPDLSEANLHGANLLEAILGRADLREAKLGQTQSSIERILKRRISALLNDPVAGSVTVRFSKNGATSCTARR